MQFLSSLNFLNTYRPSALIAFIISISAFIGAVFHVFFRLINDVAIPTPINNFILEALIIMFLLGGFFCFCCWLDIDSKNHQQEISQSVANVFWATCILAMFFLPEYIYLFNQSIIPQRAYTQLYLFAQVYLLNAYLAYCIFQYKKLLPLNFIGIKRICWNVLIGLIVIATFANFYRDYVPQIVRSFNITLVLVIAIYFSFQLKWITQITTKKRITIILQLLIISLYNCYLVYHYYTEEDKGVFNILSIPTDYYLCLLIFSISFSTIALVANTLYLPIAKVLAQKENEISSLTQMSKFIENKENLDDVFNYLLLNSVKDTEAKAGWVLLSSSNGKVVFKSKNINIDQASKINHSIKINYPLALQQLAHINILNTSLYKPDIDGIDDFYSLAIFEIKLNKNETALLYIAHEDAEAFDDYHVQMVQSYIGQTKIAYENQQLFSASIQTESLKRELELASKIHKNILPVSFPQNNIYEMSGYILPSKEMGGDFYDFFYLNDDKIALLIGDVSGKGLPAALYMAEIKGIFQSLSTFNLSIEALIIKANETIKNCFDNNHFVTLTYLIIDKQNKKICYARCGHCPILYYDFKSGDFNFLDDKGMGLGIIRNDSFSNHIHVYEKHFNTNDIIVLYTDGLIEAIDKKSGKKYDLDALKHSLSTSRKATANDIKLDILNDFNNIIRHQENPDDIALIVVKFT